MLIWEPAPAAVAVNVYGNGLAHVHRTVVSTGVALNDRQCIHHGVSCSPERTGMTDGASSTALLPGSSSLDFAAIRPATAAGEILTAGVAQ